MLHGFMGTSKSHFSSQIDYFKEKYELVFLDLPGHGDSPLESTEDYFEHALEYVISRLKVGGEGYLMGLSLGASLAVHISLREPELVKGTILTGYTPYIPERLKEVMEKQYDYFINIEENNTQIAQSFENLHGNKWRKTLEHVLHTMTFKYPGISKADFEKLNTPVLLLNGSNDKHEVEAVAYVKENKEDALIGLIPGAGHTANLDQPDVFNRIVEDFLELRGS